MFRVGDQPCQHQKKEPPSSSSQGHGAVPELAGTRDVEGMELARGQQSRLSTPKPPVLASAPPELRGCSLGSAQHRQQ